MTWLERLFVILALVEVGLLVVIWWPSLQTKDDSVPSKLSSIYWEISWKHIAMPDTHWIYAREDDEDVALLSFWECVYSRGIDTICELWEHANGGATLKHTYEIDFTTWDRLHPAKKECECPCPFVKPKKVEYRPTRIAPIILPFFH